MAMEQQARQLADEGVVGDQQEVLLAAFGEEVQRLARVAVGRQPGRGADGAAESQGLAHQLGGLLRTHVRAGEYRAQRPSGQLGGTVQHFLATVTGQLALGVGAGASLGLTVAQQPEPHSLGSSSRTGWAAGGTS
ncbi:hypothetical protein D3C77_626240 [compost metagenome]